jgi:hypothetical protein
MFDNVTFDGFSRGLKIGSDVLIGDAIRIINSEFADAKNELDLPAGKVKLDGKDLSQ